MTRFVYVLPAGRFRWEVRTYAEAWESTAGVCACGHSAGHHANYVGGCGLKVGSGVCPCDEFNRSVRPPHKTAEIQLFYRRKAHALIAARAIALVIGGEVQPHDRRGRIQDPDSYGSDSPRRRG